MRVRSSTDFLVIFAFACIDGTRRLEGARKGHGAFDLLPCLDGMGPEGSGALAMGDAIAPRVLSTLIASIYDCTLDPDRWEGTLSDIRDALECQNAQLHLNDLPGNRLLISKIVGFEWPNNAEEHLPEAHARLTEFFAAHPSLDEPFVAMRDLPHGYADTSPYFQEIIRPMGLVDMMQYCLMQAPDRFGGLGFARNQ